MRKMLQKIISSLIIIILFFPLTQDSSGAPRSEKSAETRFNSAISCKDSLRQSKKKQRYRANWEKCIKKFISVNIYTTNNEDRLNEISIFHAAELYLELYRYSGKKSDLINAKDLFTKLTIDYPGSKMYKSSIEKINTIDRIINDRKDKGDVRKNSARVKAKDIRSWSYPKYTRIVLDIDALVTFEQTASVPEDNVTLNLHDLAVGEDLKKKIEAINDSIIREVRVSERGFDIITISFKLDGLKKFKAFPLSSPPRLVIDIFGEDSERKGTPQSPDQTPPKKEATVSGLQTQKIDTIIIDPGHGGKDPGAIGRSGLTEKEVVLDIGLRLKEMLIKKMGKKVIITRKTDVFIPLDERSRLANGSNGELFVSIHANSSPKRHTRGIEVYLLGAPSDKRALATAARENATSEEDVNYLQAILNELAKDFNTERSLEFAHLTMESFSVGLKKRYNMVKLGVKRAPFYVLVHTDMPSILAEISFISNPYEEDLLKKDDYRQKIAESLFEGIKEYIQNQQGQIPS